MKKYLFSILAFMMFFCGLVVVDAKTYTAYEVGDKVSINVNDTEKKDFYVISESDETSTTVTAVYEDVLGEMMWFGPTSAGLSGSQAEANLKTLTANWNNPTEIRLLKGSEILKDFVVSVNVSEDFTTPTYFNIGKSYWTQDVAVNGEIYYPLLVTTWNTYSNIHASTNNAPASGGYIRPVVTVSKDYVVGGLVEEDIDYQQVWKEFIEKFQKTELIHYWEDEEIEVDVDYTDTTMTVTMTDTELNETYVTNFVYEDGVVKYVPIGTVNEDNLAQAIYNQLWIVNCIYTISDIKGYDVEQVLEDLETENNYNIEIEGLIYKTKNYNYSETSDSGSVDINLDYATDFQLDIVNGIEIYETGNNVGKVDNPKTGISFPIGIAVMALIVSGGIFLLRNKKYFKKG